MQSDLIGCNLDQSDVSISQTSCGRQQARSFKFEMENRRAIAIQTNYSQSNSFLYRIVLGQQNVNPIGAIGLSMTHLASTMWVDTIAKHQCRYNLPMAQTFSMLYREGGIRRFYCGSHWSLVLKSLGRVGSIASRGSIIYSSENFNMTLSKQSILLIGATTQALCRVVWNPVEVFLTMSQTEGRAGADMLRYKVKRHGYRSLFHGGRAAFAQSITAHYPWLLTYQMVSTSLPAPKSRLESILHSTIVGFSSAVVADILSNPFRYVKQDDIQHMWLILCYRIMLYVQQSHHEQISYPRVFNLIQNRSRKSVVFELFCRGLPARFLLHGIQGTIFSIIYKLL